MSFVMLSRVKMRQNMKILSLCASTSLSVTRYYFVFLHIDFCPPEYFAVLSINFVEGRANTKAFRCTLRLRSA